MGFTGPPEPARSRPQRVSVITVSIALLAILATLWPAVSAQIYQHVELKDKEERGVARTQYVIAPLW